MTLTLYGIDLSQPTRSVRWVLLANNIDHEYITIMPGSKKQGGSRSKEYLEINPNGTVPCLVDNENGIKIWESGAILLYICEKYKLNTLYPNDNSNNELKWDIQSWLHWHHHGSRQFTLGVAAPTLRPEFKFTTEQLERNKKLGHSIAKFLDNHLSKNKYLGKGSKSATIADIIVYGDLGQCQSQYLNLFDFSSYPYLSNWLKDMESQPGFNESHDMLQSFSQSIAQRKASKESSKSKI